MLGRELIAGLSRTPSGGGFALGAVQSDRGTEHVAPQLCLQGAPGLANNRDASLSCRNS